MHSLPSSTVTETDVQPQLYRLSELDDCEVVEECPDARGWAVVSTDGQRIGIVKDFIVEHHILRIRYLLVEVTHAPAKEKEVAYLLIPIGLAEVDAVRDRILLPAIKAELIPRLPTYRAGQIRRDYEWAIRRTLARPDGQTPLPPPDAFYDHSLFDDARFLERRRRSLRDRADSQSLASGLNASPYLRRRRR